MAREVLAVLAYLHERNVVHRDVKPSNLLLDSEGRVRLADLGLARPLDDPRDLTRTTAAVGTPAYMSPEQIRGEPAAPAADLYGLGATLFQLLTGYPPYTGSSEYEVATQHVTARVPDPRRIDPSHPAWLARFIMRLLEKRPRDRFASARAALAALERRRVRVSPRVWRRAAAAVVAAAALAGAVPAARALRRHPAATAAVAGEAVTVADAAGRVLWRREFPEREPATLVADVLGDREPEVVVALASPGRDGARGSAEIAVLSGRGAELARVPVGRHSFANAYPELSWGCATPELAALDLDGDGRTELAWSVAHATLFPCELGAWMARAGMEPGAVLVHSGHLSGVSAADLDGDGRAELVAAGVDNPLGFQTVVVAVEPLQARARRGFEALSSPDQTRVWGAAAARVSADRSTAIVTPLGPYRGWARVASAGPGGIVVRTRDQEVRLDAAGNPEGSPLFGRGPAPRWAFWDRLARGCQAVEGGSEAPAALLAVLRAAHGDALAEPPMALAAELLVSRSAARAGLHDAALAVLEQGARRDPEVPDLLLRLGEQLFIAGLRQRALTVLADAARPRPAGRNGREAMIALALGASLDGDEATVREVQETWARVGGVRPGIDAFQTEIRAVWAFQRGRWADAVLAAPLAGADIPVARVLPHWAALERGEPVDQAALADLADDAETRDLAGLLVARAAVGVGSAGSAREAAERAATSLRVNGRTSLETFVWVPLAERVLADVLVACGEPAAAAPHARAAARLAPACWFGR